MFTNCHSFINRALITWLLCLSFNTFADTACKGNSDTNESDKCWYLSGGFGISQLEPDENNSGFNITDDTDLAFKITAAYVFDAHWFAELSYSDLGQASLANNNPALPQNLNIDYSSLSLSAGYWVFDRQSEWNIFFRAGLGSVDTSSNFEQFHERQHSEQFILGAGIQWRYHNSWFVRAEFDSFEKDARYLGLSIGRFFGGSR